MTGRKKTPWLGVHWGVSLRRVYRHRAVADMFYGVTIFGRYAVGVIVDGRAQEASDE